MQNTRRNRSGITLVEVIVVIVVCTLTLFGIFNLIPRIMEQKIKQRTLQTGVGCYKAIFASYSDPDFDIRNDPVSTLNINFGASWASSTDYMRFLIEKGWIESDYSVFGIPRYAPPISTTKSNEFTSANNGWNVSTDLFRGMNPSLPFITTCNLGIQRLDQNLEDCELSFWNEVVVITKGGHGKMVSEMELRTMTNGFDSATNRVLRP